MVISGEYVCCSSVFGTMVGVSVFSVIWSELRIISAISAISVRVPENKVCVNISGED